MNKRRKKAWGRPPAGEGGDRGGGAAGLSDDARWIWDESDPASITQYHLLALRIFDVDAATLQDLRRDGGAWLRIAAESYYQVWLNGHMLGHGPAKSPEGERFVDVYDLSLPDRLREGDNRLEVLVHALGAGTMNACPDAAGLLFEIGLPGGRRIPSDAGTWVQPDPQRRHRTVRRWMMPCLEDVDATCAVAAADWRPARVLPPRPHVRLLPRPVALPSRRPFAPHRVVALDQVELPRFSVTFRVKPYLVDEREQRRNNLYWRSAFIVTDLVSECAQEIELVPTAGQVTWYFEGRKVARGSGWERWPEDHSPQKLRLRRGSNRLIGLHAERSHFQDVHLAAFASHPLRVKNPFGRGGFQVVCVDDLPLPAEPPPTLSPRLLVRAATDPFPPMDPRDTMPDANSQDLTVNARPAPLPPSLMSDALAACRPCSLTLPPPPAGKGHATRLILDLGEIQNGWIAFSAYGRKGDLLILSFFESMDAGAPPRIVWTSACNNGFRYRLRDGWQKFESLFAYGVRYIAIQHEGASAVELRDLRLLSANCGRLSSATFRTGDLALDNIHALCEQTLRAATDDTLTDCPTYEAVNWNFDNRLGAMADLVAFRNLPLLRNTIEQFTRDPMYPGLVRSHAPSTWENRIPAFSFHWIILCRDFHWHTADAAFAQRVFPQVARGLDEALAMIDPRLGLLRWRDPHDSWHIIDWAQGRDDEHEIVSAEQALLLGALEAGEYLAEAQGRTARGTHAIHRWKKARASLRDAIDRHLWCSARDAYRDSLHADGTPSPVSSQVSNAALALHGAGSPAWRTRLHRRLQTGDPALPPYGSPMGLFYILEYLDAREDPETIFTLIRQKWGPMLAAGDKTAWEHFPEFTGQADRPTRSRCHPFATYILKYYAKYLLGLVFDTPGQTRVRFAPRPPADLDHCQGCIPVADGWIRVSWRRRSGGGFDTTIQAPPNVRVIHSPS